MQETSDIVRDSMLLSFLEQIYHLGAVLHVDEEGVLEFVLFNDRVGIRRRKRTYVVDLVSR